jgi:hypothetical protein
LDPSFVNKKNEFPHAFDTFKRAPRPTDSAWETAKREYYGEPSGQVVVASPGEEYDENKVSALKSTLLEALKSAANIRGLKSSDSLIVCVSGAASTVVRPVNVKLWYRKRSDVALQYPQQNRFDGPEARGLGSLLTLRAKKPDIDALASGKLTPQEFSKVVAFATYPVRASQMSFGGPNYPDGPGQLIYTAPAPNRK